MDNFGHMGGLISGLFAGFVLVPAIGPRLDDGLSSYMEDETSVPNSLPKKKSQRSNVPGIPGGSVNRLRIFRIVGTVLYLGAAGGATASLVLLKRFVCTWCLTINPKW